MPLLLCLGLSLLTAVQQPDYGAFKLGKLDVPVIVPEGTPRPAVSEEQVNGWTYGLDASGQVIAKKLGSGGWEEFKELWARKAKPVADWKTKIVLLTRGDSLQKDPNGVLWQQRSGFYNPDRDAALKSVALFGAMVEAYSGGKLRFVPDLQIEDEANKFESYGQEFVSSYFEPRLNAGSFVPDDKVFRGPYNSVFFIHAGLTQTAVSASANNTPVNGLPFYFDYDAKRPGELARHMFNAWVSQLLFLADRHGYQLGLMPELPNEFGPDPLPLRLPQAFITDAMWPTIANAKDTNDFASNFPTSSIASAKWSEVRDNPWMKLPRIDRRSLQGDQALLAELADSLIPVAKWSSLTFVEPEYMDYLSSKQPDLECLGYMATKSGPKIIVKSSTIGSASGHSSQSEEGPYAGFDGDKLPVGGDFGIVVSQDAERGKMWTITEDWVARNGYVRLFGASRLGSASQTNPKKYLKFWVRNATAPFEILIQRKESSGHYVLFPDPWMTASSDHAAIASGSSAAWRQVCVDTSASTSSNDGSNIHRQVLSEGIYLVPGDAYSAEVDPSNKPSIMISGVELSDSGTPTIVDWPKTLADAASSDPYARALFASQVTDGNYAEAKAKLLPLLADHSDYVVLNSEAVYLRIKDKDAEVALAKLSKSINERIAQYALQALAFQGTDSARGAILQALELGPFEHNRRYAAEVLSPQKDRQLGGLYSNLIASRSWQTRLAAVRGLGIMSGERAQIIMLSFLLDTTPEVVMNIAKLADTSQDLVSERMQWYSLNDPYDAVRAEANIALLRSNKADLRILGLKGLQDDSYYTRILVLQYLKDHSSEESLPAIKVALKDVVPDVRVAALDTLAHAPGETNLNDLDVVANEKDPRVQAALISLAAAKHIKLSPAILESLRKSVDPEVVKESLAAAP